MGLFRYRAALCLALVAAAGCTSAPADKARPQASTFPSSPATPTPVVDLLSLARLRWAAAPGDSLSPRRDPIVAWTGNELLVVGGSGLAGGALATGSAYDPVAKRWEPLPVMPLEPRASPASTWTGSELLLWGGSVMENGMQTGPVLRDGVAFDPRQNRWSVLPAGPLPALTGAVAVTDDDGGAVILGGSDNRSTDDGGEEASRLVARYDPRTERWNSVPGVPVVAGHTLVSVDAVRWGPRLLVAATWVNRRLNSDGSGSIRGGVDLYLLDSRTGTWSRFRPAAELPLIYSDLKPIEADLVVAGGSYCPPAAACPASLTTPFAVLDATGKPQPATPHAPIKPSVSTVAGSNYVLITGSTISGSGHRESPGDMAGYDPSRHRWVTLPSAHLTSDPESLTWTGRQFLLWTSAGLLVLGS